MDVLDIWNIDVSINTNMCNIRKNISNSMYNQPMKNRQDLKPLDICNTAWKSNKESTSELGVCIVLGVFKGWLNGMDDVITWI